MGNLLTTDAELTTVANAIRSKGGTSAQLGFPTGMKNAIDALNVGTGLNPAAAAGDIRAGKKAVVNRTTITGTAPERTSSDLTQSGPTVTAPAGYYASAASRSVGTARSSSDMTQSGPTVTAPAGYYASDASKSVGTARSSADLTVSGNTVTAPAGYYGAPASKSVGTIQGATTFAPSTSNQTIASDKYLTGTQTITGVTASGLTAGNVRYGVSVATNVSGIGTVAGTFTKADTVSTGKTAAGPTEIRNGYAAWVNGAQVNGTIADKAGETIYPSFSEKKISANVYLTGQLNYRPLTTLITKTADYATSKAYEIKVYSDSTDHMITTFNVSATYLAGTLSLTVTETRA